MMIYNTNGIILIKRIERALILKEGASTLNFIKKHPYICLGLFSLIIFLLGSYNLPITDTVESNYAQTAKEMLIAKDWISPQIYGRYWYDKPIFYYWELMISFSVFGFTEIAARIPGAVFGMLGVLFTYDFTSKVYSQKTGFLASLILISSFEMWLLTHSVLTDVTLFLFMSMSVAYFYLGYTRNKNYYYLCYITAALSTLTKGPVGLALPGLACVIFLLYKKDIKELLKVKLISGIILFLIITSSWYGTMYGIHGNDFLLNFFGVHNYLRATVSEHPAQNVWYFYILMFFVGFAPWSFFLVYKMYKKYKEKTLSFKKSDNLFQLLIIYSVVVFAFFQCIATKYTTYTFPMLFALSIMTAKLYTSNFKKIINVSVVFSVIYTLLLIFAAPPYMAMNAGKETGEFLKFEASSEKPVYFYENYSTSMVFYSDRKIYSTVEDNEFEDVKPGKLDWNAKNVMPLIKKSTALNDKDCYIITKNKKIDKFKNEISKIKGANIQIVKSDASYTIWHKTQK